MGIHKAKLTPSITSSRCHYLWGQYRRNHLFKRAHVEPVIRRSLPVREDEIENLKNSFEQFIGECHDMIFCDECGIMTDCYEYDGDRRLCDGCQ